MKAKCPTMLDCSPKSSIDKVIEDKTLSFKAKGLFLSLVLSRDKQYRSLDDLVSQSTDGLTKIRSGLKELMKAGYVTRVANRDSFGSFISFEYILS